MKNKILLLLFIGLATAFGCKDAINAPATTTEKDLSLSEFLGAVGERSLTDGSEYANVYVINRENVDARVSRIFTTCAASFKSNDLNSVIYPGALTFDGQQVNNYMSDFMYLKEFGNAFQTAVGTSKQVRLTSNAPDYQSFIQNIYQSRPIRARSSTGLTDQFNRNSDLNLSWVSDPGFPNAKTYIAICCQGSPAVIKEVDGVTSLTISQTEFANFQPGKRVFMFIGRGFQSTINQANGKSICIYSIAYAKSIGYTVV